VSAIWLRDSGLGLDGQHVGGKLVVSLMVGVEVKETALPGFIPEPDCRLDGALWAPAEAGLAIERHGLCNNALKVAHAEAEREPRRAESDLVRGQDDKTLRLERVLETVPSGAGSHAGSGVPAEVGRRLVDTHPTKTAGVQTKIKTSTQAQRHVLNHAGSLVMPGNARNRLLSISRLPFYDLSRQFSLYPLAGIYCMRFCRCVAKQFGTRDFRRREQARAVACATAVLRHDAEPLRGAGAEYPQEK